MLRILKYVWSQEFKILNKNNVCANLSNIFKTLFTLVSSKIIDIDWLILNMDFKIIFDKRSQFILFQNNKMSTKCFNLRNVKE